jgi:hypothetical protein
MKTSCWASALSAPILLNGCSALSPMQKFSILDSPDNSRRGRGEGGRGWLTVPGDEKMDGMSTAPQRKG